MLITLCITTVYAGTAKDDVDIEENVLSNSSGRKTSKKIKLYKPPLRQRLGAIRGVSIRFLVQSKEERLAYKLISPPKGMTIIETIVGNSCMTPPLVIGKSGILVQWDVPMDAIEGKAYAITVEATEKNHNPDYLPKKGRVTFDVKVPKTTPIETTLKNNELVVTDKNSPLYGMKMKGHNGEDISHMKLRSVGYGDVWRKRVEPTSPNDKAEHIVFVIDNMPEALDVKMPEWMDTYEERINIGMHSYKYKYDATVVLINDYWGRASSKSYLYDNTNGYVYLHKMNGSEIFLISLEEAQNKGEF